MLALLESLHSLEYIHGDLKPDNILVGDFCETGDLNHLKLIDFGMATSFTQKLEKRNTWQHKEFGHEEGFGNLAFACPNSILGLTLSRKDDLISLCLMLINLYIGTTPHYIDGQTKEEFKQRRLGFTAEKVKSQFGCHFMADFATAVFETEFEAKPDYS